MKSTSHSPLDSSTAHRQSAVLGWALKGILVLLLSYAIGWVLEQYQWATYQFPQTVLWCSVPYAITAYWLYNGAYLPQFEERRFLLVATAAPYLAAPLGLHCCNNPIRAALCCWSTCCLPPGLLWGTGESEGAMRCHSPIWIPLYPCG